MYQSPEVVQDSKAMWSGLTVSQMMQTIAKAYVACGERNATLRIRQMTLPKLQKEFAWAVVYLDSRGLLTDAERQAAKVHERDFLDWNHLATAN